MLRKNKKNISIDNYHWVVFYTVAIALFAMVLDFSIVVLALPTIANQFEVSLKAVSWVIISSSLITSAFMLPLGAVSDIIGRKKFHIAGMIFFVLGAILCYTSTSLEHLIFGRIIMAIGSTMGQSVVFAIIVGVFPKDQKGKGLGMITTAVSIGAASGPLFAGPIISIFGWREIFLVTAIPTFIGIIFAAKILDEKKLGSNVRENKSYDFIGSFVSIIFLSLLTIVISNPFSYSITNIEFLTMIFFTLVFFGFYIFWELRIDNPMIDLGLFRFTTFRWSSLTRFLGFIASAPAFLLVPIFVQSFMGYDETATGLLVFFGAFFMGFSSQFSGRLSDKYGFRKFTSLGMIFIIISNLSFSFFTQDTSIFIVLLVLIINGFGMGLWMAPNMSATLASVLPSQYGSTSAFLNLVRNTATVIGQAISTAIITGIMLSNNINVQLSEISDSINPNISSTFNQGWDLSFKFSACVAFLALFASYKTRKIKID